MAGGAIVQVGKAGVAYEARMTVYTWAICILGGCGGLLLGFDNGVIGGITSMAAFQKKFFPSVYLANEEGIGASSPYCKYNNQILQLVVSSLYISALFFGLFSAQFARAYGRKPVLFVSGVGFLVGTGLQAGAADTAMVIVGRVCLGVGVGLCSLVMPMYNAEVAPAHLRGAMNILFQLFVTIGILAAGLINYGADYIPEWGWRLSFACGAIPAFIVLFASIVLPESPNSLIERGHFEKGRAVLERIRGTKNVGPEFDDIVEAAAEANAVKHPFRNLFRAQYRPQLVISLLFMLFQQFTGINAIVFYAPVLFSSIGNGHTGALLNTVIIGAVNVLSTLIAVALVDRVGRRKLLLAGGVQMIIFHIAVAIVLKYEFAQYGSSLPIGISWGILVLICCWINAFAWSWGPIGWLYPTEIQPMETRAAASSINVASNMLFTFVIGQTFVTMLCAMEWGVFLFFMGFVIIMTLWVYFFLPETRNTPIEDVFRLFQNHWFWGRLPAIHAGLPTSAAANTYTKGQTAGATPAGVQPGMGGGEYHTYGPGETGVAGARPVAGAGAGAGAGGVQMQRMREE